MKTAKEILRKHIPEPTNEGEKNDDVNIIKAMEEYAKQISFEEIEKFVIQESGYHPDTTFAQLGKSQLDKASKMYNLLVKFSQRPRPACV